MAGGLTISTLNNDTGVLQTQNGMNGIAKAWVNFNGSTAAINGSFNVGSITKNGTGDYTVNFTTAMPNANYVFSGTATYDTTWGAVVFPDNSLVASTTQFRFRVAGTAAYNVIDALRVTVAFNGV